MHRSRALSCAALKPKNMLPIRTFECVAPASDHEDLVLPIRYPCAIHVTFICCFCGLPHVLPICHRCTLYVQSCCHTFGIESIRYPGVFIWRLCVIHVLSLCYLCSIRMLSICYPCVILVFTACFPRGILLLCMCFPCVIPESSMCYACVIHVLCM